MGGERTDGPVADLPPGQYNPRKAGPGIPRCRGRVGGGVPGLGQRRGQPGARRASKVIRNPVFSRLLLCAGMEGVPVAPSCVEDFTSAWGEWVIGRWGSRGSNRVRNRGWNRGRSRDWRSNRSRGRSRDSSRDKIRGWIRGKCMD